LSTIGQSQDTHALEQMVKEVGEKAENSTAKAAELTRKRKTPRLFGPGMLRLDVS
jgi:hypothetical protein